MTVAQLLKRAQQYAADNSPAILTGVVISGTVLTAYFTGKASFRAAEIIEQERQRLSFRSGSRVEDLPLRMKAELTWKLYIPAFGAACMTIACAIASNQIGTRRTASLAAGLSLAEKGFTEYKAKVIEKFGENKERDMRDEIAQDRVNNNPASTREIIITGSGSHLCYDMYSGRYFESDMETLKRAQNELNHKLNGESYVSLNHFYTLIGLRPTKGSEEIGWRADGDLVELDFSVVMSEDQRPCLSFSFNLEPVRGYYRGF